MRILLAFGVLACALAGWLAWQQVTALSPADEAFSGALARGTAAPSALDVQQLMGWAEGGNAIVQNNLAVIAMRTRGGLPGVDADALLEAAAAAGDPAARYNLALRLPNRFDTDPEIVRRRIDLLTPGAEAGDPHAQALLAATLRSVNRDALMPDRADRRMALLQGAAASGDIDYRLLYAKALFNRYREAERPDDWYRAADILVGILAEGDGRGAEHLAFMLRQPAPAPRKNSPLPSRDPVYWYRKAAETGLGTAVCAAGAQLLRFVDALAFEGVNDTRLAEIRQRVAALDPGDFDRGLADLTHCAQMEENPRPPFFDPTRGRPFGDPSVYRRKLSGGWTSFGPQPARAALTLGAIHGFGLGVAPDPARARHYLGQAEGDGGLKQAAQLRASLPDP